MVELSYLSVLKHHNIQHRGDSGQCYGRELFFLLPLSVSIPHQQPLLNENLCLRSCVTEKTNLSSNQNRADILLMVDVEQQKCLFDHLYKTSCSQQKELTFYMREKKQHICLHCAEVTKSVVQLIVENSPVTRLFLRSPTGKFFLRIQSSVNLAVAPLRTHKFTYQQSRAASVLAFFNTKHFVQLLAWTGLVQQGKIRVS